MNTMCVANQSCALIFPGQSTCPVDGSAPRLPFPIPFGRCTCDEDGKWWPTAENWCATVVVTDPTGSGIYTLYQCPISTNATSRRVQSLRSWSPVEPDYDCQQQGTDSYLLSDNCIGLRGGQAATPLSSFCGHTGLIAQVADDGDAVPVLPIPCELAPLCPNSVIHPSRTEGRDRLDQSCCTGNPDSHYITQIGLDTSRQATSFCKSTSTASGGEPAGCPVRTTADGWRGCACLDERGQVNSEQTCTVECTPPECPLPESGVIPPTPERWLTSEVPKSQGPETPPVAAMAKRSVAELTLLLFAYLAFCGHHWHR